MAARRWKTRPGPEYVKRIDWVIDHVNANLDRPLKLDELADIACFSKFHFHKVFTAITGETLSGFVQRRRVEKAAQLLRYSDGSATEIALECGFSSSATFSRAFRDAYGCAPTEFRKMPIIKDRKIRKDLNPHLKYLLPMTLSQKQRAFPVEIKRMPAWNVAYIRTANAFEGDAVLKAYARLIDWAKREGLYEGATFFGMSIDDPEVTPKHLYRHEACLATDRPFECPPGISKTKLPSRHYAVTRVSGDLNRVATAWEYLTGGWLVASEYEPEHAPKLEVFLNRDRVLDWSHFELEGCLPVKPLARLSVK